jgi:inhibitor of cysteine peptidase
MTQFTASATGHRAELKPGQPFEIVLPETPSAGFRWQVTANGEPVAHLSGEDFQPAQGVGGQGSRTWRFEAVAAGESEIAMVLRRSWEAAAAQSFTLRVIVKGDAATSRV